ncbi:MAG: phosphodiester glycosidase family protein [Armatimonadota bacterium]|nr:phosphodiester glycosidase family protein [Armatimonadota bacterium]
MNSRKNNRQKSRTFFALLAAIFLLLIALVAAARSYPKGDYSAIRVDGHQVHLVKIDLRRKNVVIRPIVAAAPGGQDFQRIINKRKLRAAINGGYFDASFKPLGDIVADGKMLARGSQRSAIAVTKSGKVEFRRRIGGSAFNWTGCSAGLAAGPMLLRNGKSAVNPEQEGFRASSRKIRASRSAIGLTANNELLMVVVLEYITLDEMAGIMLKLGAVDAMNLDGGSSCALYGDGKIIIRPYSLLSNLLLVEEK